MPGRLPVARPRRYGQWVLATLVIGGLVLLVRAIYANPYIDHKAISRYLFDPSILSGLWVTVELSILSMTIGIVLGLVLALARLSTNTVLSRASWFYVWFFRGTPLLVQIIFWGNLGLLFRHIEIGIPYTHLTVLSLQTNSVVTPFIAAVLGLGLNEAAYMAEVFRGGVLAIEPGQAAAARALGMTSAQVNRFVVLPQVVPVILPPTGNQFISLLKASALVSVIAGGDLLTQVENIYSANYKTIELLIVASFWYIVLTSLTYVGQHVLERRFNRNQRAPGQRAATVDVVRDE